MIIYVLALDGLFDTGLAALQDTFATARQLAHEHGVPSADFSVKLVRAGRTVRTAHGLSVPAHAPNRIEVPDVVVVPALGAKTPDALPGALAMWEVARAGDLLCSWHGHGAMIAAACTGTFVLAECGLLDGRAATTSWWLAPFFRSRYPAVQLDDGRMLVNSGDVLTAGAALAHFDLALWVIRQLSPSLASLTARYLIIDQSASQAAYAIPDHLKHNDVVVERFERWARENLSSGFCLQSAADAVGASRRTLARRMHEILGKSPLAYFQDLRVARAVQLLQTTNDSVDRIAIQVGYADGATLRALLRRKLARRASEIRNLAG